MKPVENNLFLDRFLSYVKIDTQSDPGSSTYPSTEKQLDLSKKLVQELKDLGLQEIELTVTSIEINTGLDDSVFEIQ